MALIYSWKLLNWAYLRPKRLERALRKQGLMGNSYRLVYGDMKEIVSAMEEAKSKPINLDDDIKPRVLSFFIKIIQKHGLYLFLFLFSWLTIINLVKIDVFVGSECFFWLGPTPAVMITEPELVKEVLSKNNLYLKQQTSNPLAKLLALGLVTYDKSKWSKHRKIINPAFHLDKLKVRRLFQNRIF